MAAELRLEGGKEAGQEVVAISQAKGGYDGRVKWERQCEGSQETQLPGSSCPGEQGKSGTGDY